MVHGFPRQQVPAYDLLHHQDVFEDVGTCCTPPLGAQARQVAEASAAALTAMVSTATASSSQPVLVRVRSLVHSACRVWLAYRARLSPAAGRLTRPSGAVGKPPGPGPAPSTRTAPRNRPTALAGRSRSLA